MMLSLKGSIFIEQWVPFSLALPFSVEEEVLPALFPER